MALDLQPIAPAALLNEIVHEWSIRFQQERATAIDRRRRRRAGVRGRQGACSSACSATSCRTRSRIRRPRSRCSCRARRDGDGDSVHGRRQRPGYSARVPRGDLPQVRAREEPEHAAHAQLGARPRLLQARRRRARRAHLGAERRRGARGARSTSRCRPSRRTRGARDGRAERYRREGVPAHLRVSREPLRHRSGSRDGRGERPRDRRRRSPTPTSPCSTAAPSRRDAEAELRKVVRRAARERPALRSVVMGCAAALDDRRAPSLQLRGAADASSAWSAAPILPAIADALGPRASRLGAADAAQTGTRALLRIQDGCDEHCTFCATTMARGANRSRLDRRARARGDDARRAACRDRDHRNSHRHVRRGHRLDRWAR